MSDKEQLFRLAIYTLDGRCYTTKVNEAGLREINDVVLNAEEFVDLLRIDGEVFVPRHICSYRATLIPNE